MKKRMSYYLFLVSLFCVVNVLFADSVKQVQYVSPKPGSEFNTNETNIIIRYGCDISLSNIPEGLITIKGSKSGLIDGNLVISSDGKTLIFKPISDFKSGETVTVSLSKSGVLPGYEFEFKTAPLAAYPMSTEIIDDVYSDMNRETNVSNKMTKMSAINALPEIETVVHDRDALGDGYIFLTNASRVEGIDHFAIIIDNDGNIIFSETADGITYDFKGLPNGNFVYGKSIEDYTYTGGSRVIWRILDNSLTQIDSVQMGNGYESDCHDFVMLPNGHYLLFGYYEIPFDMSTVVDGGRPDAYVTGAVIQELDAQKNVIFQWRSWDYYDLNNFTYNLMQATNAVVHEFHINAIDLDDDNNILISTPTWAKKLNRQTGEIMWNLGGFDNEFSSIGSADTLGVDYAVGHTFYRIENGNILVFDNGAFFGDRKAMAHELILDEEDKTIEFIWSYIPDSLILGPYMGSTQRLPNGNTTIGWGGSSFGDYHPVYTEVNQDGDVLMEVFLNPIQVESYRAFRYPIPDGEPCAEVIKTEVAPGNTYDFVKDDSVNTGISIKINSLNGSGYNNMIVKKYNYAPMNPEFFGKAPMAKPTRIVISQSAITGIDADVMFDIEKWQVKDPENTIVYHREFEGSGLFVPLVTTYNHVTNKIVANTDKVGEFILTTPDLESMIFTPVPCDPADSGTVNQELSVRLQWNPIGYVNEYTLQVSKQVDFSELIVNEEYMTDAFYTMNEVDDNATYYWRVKAFNNAGESEWSDVQLFSTTPPYLTLLTPNGGEHWQRGLQFYIFWDDNLAEDVVFELYKGESMVSIIDTTDSDGAYQWEIDAALEVGLNYTLKIRSLTDESQFDLSDAAFVILDTTGVSVADDNVQIVEDYALHQNYPNPFNPETTIRYDIPATSEVSIKIYNLMGELVDEIINSQHNAGIFKVQYDAGHLSSGIYFYRVDARSTTGKTQFSDIKKMLVIK